MHNTRVEQQLALQLSAAGRGTTVLHLPLGHCSLAAFRKILDQQSGVTSWLLHTAGHIVQYEAAEHARAAAAHFERRGHWRVTFLDPTPELATALAPGQDVVDDEHLQRLHHVRIRLSRILAVHPGMLQDVCQLLESFAGCVSASSGPGRFAYARFSSPAAARACAIAIRTRLTLLPAQVSRQPPAAAGPPQTPPLATRPYTRLPSSVVKVTQTDRSPAALRALFRALPGFLKVDFHADRNCYVSFADTASAQNAVDAVLRDTRMRATRETMYEPYLTRPSVNRPRRVLHVTVYPSNATVGDLAELFEEYPLFEGIVELDANSFLVSFETADAATVAMRNVNATTNLIANYTRRQPGPIRRTLDVPSAAPRVVRAPSGRWDAAAPAVVGESPVLAPLGLGSTIFPSRLSPQVWSAPGAGRGPFFAKQAAPPTPADVLLMVDHLRHLGLWPLPELWGALASPAESMPSMPSIQRAAWPRGSLAPAAFPGGTVSQAHA